MVFSSTALFLAISRQFSTNQTSDLHDQQILRSCLSSGTLLAFSDHPPEEKKKQRKKRKKVKFAEDVKEPKGNGEEYRKREHLRRIVPEPVIKPEKTGSVCRNEMPANRMALHCFPSILEQVGNLLVELASLFLEHIA
ncbi:hypothetical protein YC2023_065582 [Brassica napus]